MQFPRLKERSVLPGFGLTLGFSLIYLSLLVLIPLSTIFLKTATLKWPEFWSTISEPQAVAAYKLSLGASLIGAGINVVFGVLVAWVLARYRFPGKRLVDGLVDLPFALPTAVAGIALTAVYAPNGWIGQHLAFTGVIGKHFPPEGIKVAFAPLGVVLALTFIGLPFVVRTVQPVLEDIEKELEEASASLGASRFQTFRRVVWPLLVPAVLSGFALAFSRALGEYGSVVFISGNIPMESQIAPLLIMTKLEQFNYAGATAIALVLLVASFLMLLLINLLQWWGVRRGALGG